MAHGEDFWNSMWKEEIAGKDILKLDVSVCPTYSRWTLFDQFDQDLHYSLFTYIYLLDISVNLFTLWWDWADGQADLNLDY